MKNKYLKIMLATLSFGASVTFAQNKAEEVKILKATNVQELKTLEKNLELISVKEKENAIKFAKQKGLALKQVTKNGATTELVKVLEDGTPIYFTTFNANASKSTRANTLNTGGILGLELNGENMRAYVWDAGIARLSHQEYDGPGGSNRVSSGDNTTITNDHSGHVMGTILASGYQAAAKGMAPRAKGFSFDWNKDKAEAANAAAQGMLLSNHSYGYTSNLLPNYYFGAYIDEARDWDEIMYNAPYYLMCVAAGNDGTVDYYNGSPLDGNSAYDKLTGHAVSKNNLVVANYEDANIDAQGNLISTQRTVSSSEGPTDDYRVKPDIAGNGYLVYSSDVQGDASYQTMTGTSMATPNVTGTLLLLQQYYNNLHGNFMKAATLKGLALHTADDLEMEGPDAVSGWGLLNAKRAAQTISQDNDQNGSIIRELTLNNNGTYSIEVEANGTEDLVASICWTDPAGTAKSGINDHTPVLVNDLDLRVVKDATTYYPWKLTSVNTNDKGDNNVDPFEKIQISNPSTSGKYVINISHKGTLKNNSQNYSLIITGAKNDETVTPPTPPTPPTSCTPVTINLVTDKYGSETSWDIKDANSQIVASGNKYVGNTTYEFKECLTEGCYTFTIYDSYGDGICCANGNGSYSVEVGGKLVASGGNFAKSETTRFCIGEDDTDTEAPSTPINLSSSNTTANSTTLNWSASTDNVGVTGYKIYKNNVYSTTTTSTSKVIDGLVANTTYTFTVTAIDKAGNESAKSNIVSVKTLSDVVSDYCESKGNNSNSEWINLVKIGNVSKSSGNDGGYKDNTDLVASVPKGYNSIYLKPGFAGSSYTEKWYVWVDLDQDGIFSSSELLYTTTSSTSNMVLGSITIPPTALTGNTRMRVAMKYSADNSPCGTFNYGEVEDYTLNITNSTYSTNNIDLPNDDTKIDMVIYPNPIKSGNVTVKSSVITEGSYEVISLDGKLVKFGNFNNGSLEISVDGLASGKYIVRISKNGKSATKNLLVM